MIIKKIKDFCIHLSQINHWSVIKDFTNKIYILQDI